MAKKTGYAEVAFLLNEIRDAQIAMKKQVDALESTLDKREHIDKIVYENRLLLSGNGKPGFAAIRDKVMNWDGKFTALSLLVIGNIVVSILAKYLAP